MKLIAVYDGSDNSAIPILAHRGIFGSDVTAIDITSNKTSDKRVRAVKALKKLGVKVVPHTQPNQNQLGILEHILSLAGSDDTVILNKDITPLSDKDMENIGKVMVKLADKANTIIPRIGYSELVEIRESVVKSEWKIELKDVLDGV